MDFSLTEARRRGGQVLRADAPCGEAEKREREREREREKEGRKEGRKEGTEKEEGD
jgi:hypothetical protein